MPKKTEEKPLVEEETTYTIRMKGKVIRKIENAIERRMKASGLSDVSRASVLRTLLEAGADVQVVK